jgi:hypothetical protein
MFNTTRWIRNRININEESPLYSGNKTDLATSEAIVQDLLYLKPYDKYAPFNFFRLANNTNKDLKVNFGITTIIVPAGTISSIDGTILKAFNSFVIETTDGASATGSIIWNFQKVKPLREVFADPSGGEI